MYILLGNTFPVALVRKPVKITPVTIEQARYRLDRGFLSFWGHSNTIAVANAVLGVDVTPKTERPVLTLSKEGLPKLEGITVKRVLVLSPNYTGNFRPSIGEEVPAEKIDSWQCLLWHWVSA